MTEVVNDGVSRPVLTIGSLRESIGQEILISPWISVSQDEVNRFGAVTRDPDPNHIDVDYAKRNSPFGAPVLFGFQTLSMLSHLAEGIRVGHDDNAETYEANYGLNKVRFITPIYVGARFRNRMSVKSIEKRDDNAYMLITDNVVEVEGQDKPAMTAEWLFLLHFGE